jgi:phosphatidyl-myo-inositol dimannoside synthase
MRRVLVLVTDAYGGRGGIATYNRNLLRAICEHPAVDRVLAIPRIVTYELEAVPNRLEYRLSGLKGKLRYLLACLQTIYSESRFDLIVCGHIHLLPVARILGLVNRCPVVPVIYGVDAWTPTSRLSVNLLCRGLKAFISIRKFTARRLIEWANLPRESFYYLPNCIDESAFGIRPARPDLIQRYGLAGKTVLLTAGRLDKGHDLKKGFDEVLEVLPKLAKRIPNIKYIVMGDGADRERLEAKARELAVDHFVVFTGYVSDAEKADHYRLADVFAMPGSNPEFDRYPYRFVFLEALACGVPVVGCKLNDRSEQDDPDSDLIIQVDPNDHNDIISGILTALSRPKGRIQPELQNFYFNKFKERLHEIVTQILSLQRSRTLP